MDRTPDTRLNLSAGLLSVTVALVLVLAKLWALDQTGSLAIAATLADSAMDLMMSLGGLAAIAPRYRARRVSREHRPPANRWSGSARRKENGPGEESPGPLGKNPGNVLLSHARARAVPSALEGLTSEFEMGSGMAPPTSSPEKLVGECPRIFVFNSIETNVLHNP